MGRGRGEPRRGPSGISESNSLPVLAWEIVRRGQREQAVPARTAAVGHSDEAWEVGIGNVSEVSGFRAV